MKKENSQYISNKINIKKKRTPANTLAPFIRCVV